MRNAACAWIVSATLLVTSTGCYHYRVVVPGAPAHATEPRRVRVNSYLWGIINDPDVLADNCVSGKLSEVHATTNLGYILISVLTVGLWVPLDLEWQCEKTTPPGGGLRP